MRGAALALALLAAGCASPSPAPAPGIVIEAGKVRIVVPAGESVVFDGAGEFTRGGVTIRTRAPSVEVGGEDFSVVAEEDVRIRRFDGKRTFEEGPYRLVLYRNGQILTR